MEINNELWFGIGNIEEYRSELNTKSRGGFLYTLKIKHLNGFEGIYWFAGSDSPPFHKGGLLSFQISSNESLKHEREIINIEFL
ncbi:TPA: hypothetical protein ACJ75O_000870 [Yersinia enterocolitica]|nr:hypothetical protein [Yersinia enterocolitica]HEI6802839.1 hypothetical protein [Yersinia enterocolitica]HEI6967979.1 hypothetical protein [Yersinia enterocolitica]